MAYEFQDSDKTGLYVLTSFFEINASNSVFKSTLLLDQPFAPSASWDFNLCLGFQFL